MSAVVDVVVPCYNYARYLRGCVASVLGQVGGAVRILIIDDASSDDTAEVASAIAASDARVTFQRHEKNRGHIATYNEGLIDWATSRYSVLLSADDLLAPGSLDRAVALMDANPAVGMTYGLATTFTDGENPVATQTAGDSRVIPGARFIKRVCERGNPVPTPASIVRTELQQKIGGYKKELPHSGDMEMWMLFAVHGSVGIINATQAFYRVHAASMSTQYYQNVIRDRREQLQACASALDHAKGSIPDFPGWVDSMSRRFASECFWAASHAIDRGDVATARACLDQAAGFDSTLPDSLRWKKAKFKLWLGPDRWNRVRGFVDALRRNAAASPAAPAGLVTGQRIGWWPDPAEL